VHGAASVTVGPERRFADCLNAATQLSHCGRSRIARDFDCFNVGQRTMGLTDQNT
jgi:hypothetical protein